MPAKTYIEVDQNTGREFIQRGIKGPVVMLNLLRFKAIADYSQAQHLQPEKEISGQAAYELYMQHTIPLLQKAGSELLFFGEGSNYLIGPQEQNWDMLLLVKHASVEKFLAFAADKSYLQIAGHRTAALADSRLLPINEKKLAQ